MNLSTKKTPELLKEAQCLRNLGLSYSKIGKQLGLGKETVRCWLNPDALDKSKETQANWYLINKESKKSYRKKYYRSNLDRCKKLSRKYYEDNTSNRKYAMQQWVKNNRTRVRLLSSRYRARKRDASIQLTSEEQSQMMVIFENCPNGYHVDHIIPLSKGGLHHPLNLQYLSASDNITKHNNIRQEDIELFRYRLINETADTHPMTFMDLLESLLIQ